MKHIKGNWIMEKDEIIKGDLKVDGSILGKDGKRFNLTVELGKDGKRFNLTVEGDLNCGDLNCGDLNCGDLNCGDLNCGDLNCFNLNCRDLNFYAIAIAYKSFKCKSWEARRDNYVIKCLDGDIEVLGKEAEA